MHTPNFGRNLLHATHFGFTPLQSRQILLCVSSQLKFSRAVSVMAGKRQCIHAFHACVFLGCLASCLGCGWPTITAGKEILGDTVVEIFQSDGSPALSFYGKVAGFGPCPVKQALGVSHPLTVAHYRQGDSALTDGCKELETAKESALFIKRGTCNFANKTLNAAAAGASTVLIGNEARDKQELFLMSCPEELMSLCANITIPAVMLSPNDTAGLVNAMSNAAPGVTFTSKVFARPRNLLDPSSGVLWAIAVCTVIIAAFVSSAKERRQPNSPLKGQRAAESASEIPMQEIGMLHAVGFIFAASGALVLLFFFIRSVIFFMIIMYCFASVSAFTAVAFGPLQAWFPALAVEANLPLLGKLERSAIIAFCGGTAMACTWFFNRHEVWAWPIQDVLSVSLCIHILSLIKFPDAKVSATLLCLALFYDIFWVFLSPLLFSENVMVGVATGEGHNYNATNPPPPPSDMIPMLIVVPKISDWAGGVTLLGLGDIVLPGLMVGYALRMDLIRRGTCMGGYFVLLCFGYGIGLAMAIVASVLMQMGQPALLYLVPCTLIPFFSLAWARGEVQEMWNGPASKAQLVSVEGDVEAEGDDSGVAPLEAATGQTEEIHQRLLDKGE